MIQDIMMKPVYDIIQHYHHWPGTHPIPLTNQEEVNTTKSSKQSCPQKTHLKTESQDG
jgi:hypothetical protein